MHVLGLSLNVLLYSFKLCLEQWTKQHNSSAQELQNFSFKNVNFQIGGLVVEYWADYTFYII